MRKLPELPGGEVSIGNPVASSRSTLLRSVISHRLLRHGRVFPVIAVHLQEVAQ